MVRLFILILSMTLVVSEKISYENYKVFRLTPTTSVQLNVLHRLEQLEIKGFSFWKAPSYLAKACDLMVSSANLDQFSNLMNLTNIRYEIYVNNVQKLIDEENPPRSQDDKFNWTRYHTLEEIYAWMDSLAVQYPGKVTVVSVGKTFQGRVIKGVKLSHGQNKSGVFIEGGIHAREWISPATVTYLLNEFLTSQDAKVRNLSESYDWYIVPLFNPDGYVYTHTMERLWRKTLSKSAYCHGADANRNWDYRWMEVGASTNPCSETYGGKAAFSEIETKTISEYIKSISDKIFAYITFHSYSQLLMFPYGHTKKHLGNYNESYDIGLKAIEALSQKYGTKYHLGNIAETIYPASGGSLDWVKATFKLPISFAYELRDTGKHGFFLPADQIIPNGQEVLDSLIGMFEEAKKFGYPSNKTFT